MQLVTLHYHLNRGGVTSVIENHLRSLALLKAEQRPERAAIVYGGRAAAWNENLSQELPFDCELVAVPELEYDNLRSSDGQLPSSGQLYDALQVVLNQFDRDSTVLHVHNHCLGKNAEMAPVVCRLADEGWRLLLQIHDFAEDLRPANYQHLLSQAESVKQLHNQLYPQADQIQYVALNGRDHQVLTQAGICTEQVNLLPNPVSAMPALRDQQQLAAAKSELALALGLPEGQRLVLYPVRPIRRKNVGELLLWSLLAEDTTFALTLKPLNPQEQVDYQKWVDFVADMQLPVKFEIGSKTELQFQEVYAAADAIITTSVAEGFGMVYLEASLAGQPLVGRRLSGVCDDFLSAGMQFPGLSDTMAVPADQMDLDELKQAHSQRIKDLRAAYSLPPEESADLLAIDSCFSGDAVDFGRLDLRQQMSFLRRLKVEHELRAALRELNPTTKTLGKIADESHETTLENNRQVIAEHYSPTVIGQKLSNIYQSLLTSVPSAVSREPAIARAVLDRFVHPSQLFPIRLES